MKNVDEFFSALEGISVSRDLPKEMIFEAFKKCYSLSKAYLLEGRDSHIFNAKAYELSQWFLEQDWQKYKRENKV